MCCWLFTWMFYGSFPGFCSFNLVSVTSNSLKSLLKKPCGSCNPNGCSPLSGSVFRRGPGSNAGTIIPGNTCRKVPDKDMKLSNLINIPSPPKHCIKKNILQKGLASDQSEGFRRLWNYSSFLGHITKPEFKKAAGISKGADRNSNLVNVQTSFRVAQKACVCKQFLGG